MLSKHFVVAAWLATAAAASASVPGDSISALDLAEAQHLALAANRELGRSELDLAIARQGEIQARALRWPALEGNASYLRKSETPEFPIDELLATILPPGSSVPSRIVQLGDEDSYETKLTATEVLLAGGRISGMIAAAEHGRSQAEWSLRAAESDLLLRVTEAYFTLAKAERAIAITTAALRLSEARAADVANLLSAGLTTRDEDLAMQAHLGRVRLDLLQAKHAAELARLQLLRVLDLPLEHRVHLTTAVDALSRALGEAGLDSLSHAVAPEAVPEPDARETMPIPPRPELRALAAGVQAARERVAIERAERWPSVGAAFSGAYGRPGLNPFGDDWGFYWTVGLALHWTAWDGGRTGARIEEARLRAAQLDDLRADAAEGLRLEAEATRLRLVESRQQVELARQILSAAMERRRVVEDRFDQGQVSPSDLIEAQEEAARAELAEAAALTDLQIAVAARQRALGELPARQSE